MRYASGTVWKASFVFFFTSSSSLSQMLNCHVFTHTRIYTHGGREVLLYKKRPLWFETGYKSQLFPYKTAKELCQITIPIFKNSISIQRQWIKNIKDDLESWGSLLQEKGIRNFCISVWNIITDTCLNTFLVEKEIEQGSPSLYGLSNNSCMTIYGTFHSADYMALFSLYT